MQKALSADNLAFFARGTFEGLKRFIPGRSDSNADDGSLYATAKQIEQKISKHGFVDDSVAHEFLAAFAENVHQFFGATQPSSLPQESPTLEGAPGKEPPFPPPAEASPPATYVGKSRKRSAESVLLYALEVVKLLFRSQKATMAPLLVELRTMECAFMLLKCKKSTKKIVDAAYSMLSEFLPQDEDMFVSCCEMISKVAFSSLESEDLRDVVAQLRLMQLTDQLLKNADIVNPAFSNASKTRLAELSALKDIMQIAKKAKAELLSSGKSVFLSVGVVALAVLHGLTRNNSITKKEALRDPEFVELWSYFASNIHKMLCTISPSREDDSSLLLETTAYWAADLCELLLELCTTGSLSLARQALYDDFNAKGATSQGRAPLVLSGAAGTEEPPTKALRKWEPLPVNWDAVLGSGSFFTWRLAAAASNCELDEESVDTLLKSLTSLDITSQTGDFIYRATVATLLLLCRALPKNCFTLSRLGGVHTLVQILVRNGEVFRGLLSESRIDPEQLNVIHSSPPLSQEIWACTVGLLTVVLTNEFRKEDILLLMRALENMLTAETTAEDCELIETCFQILSTPTYPKSFLWLDGVTSCSAGSLEKFCGRWYGYSFSAWVHPICVWPDGCLLFSYSEQATPTSTCVCIVANGRSRCLAVRSSSDKEMTITLLPDTILNDDWNHIAIVHNISGFTPYINGKKCNTLNSVSYPKEPPKPHKLHFNFGGPATDHINLPPIFGMLSGVQLLDGVLAEKDIERLVAAGPCSLTTTLDPNAANPEIFRLSESSGGTVELVATALKAEKCTVVNISSHSVSCGVAAMKELDVIGWCIQQFAKLPESSNEYSVLILVLQLVSAYIKQHKDGAQEWYERKGTEELDIILRRSNELPPEVLSALMLAVTKKAGKTFMPSSATTKMLLLFIDTVLNPQLPAATRQVSLRELSNHLNSPENAKLFKEGPGMPLLLEGFSYMEVECIPDLVTIIEKLSRDSWEMEHLFRYLLVAPPNKQSTFAKCELLRMLYDVTKPNRSLMDVMVSCGGLQYLQYLMSGDMHNSEALRVYAIRLLALILHCNKKQRDNFIRSGGFDVLATAIVKSGNSAPLGLPTFNCLFKLALDFFQPNNDVHGSVLTKLREKPTTQKRVDPRSGLQQAQTFKGHMPAIMPSRAPLASPMTRQMSLGSMGSSECSDLDARLSVDDSYNTQGSSRDALVYPQCISAIMQVLARLLEPSSPQPSNSEIFLPVDGADSTDGVGSDLPSSAELFESSASVAIKVLGYMDRMVDMTHNATALLATPWLEWLWEGVSGILTDEARSEQPNTLKISIIFRSVVRKIAIVDLMQPPKHSYIRRIKDMVDCPLLQQIVIEELMNHFSTFNRLDKMDGMEATNVLRNLDTLLMGLEDCIQPFPHSLGLNTVRAISAIAVHNNSWVRTKMKGGKMFESRDRLAFSLLTSVKDFSQESVETREGLLQANMHDMNVAVFCLKSLCDAIRETSIERAEVIQQLMRNLYSMDEDQRKNIVRQLGDAEVIEAIIIQRKVVDNQEVPIENIITWTLQHEAKWEQCSQRILKAYRSLELDITARLDRREKERATKLKARRAEIEKKQLTTSKILAEHEKQRGEHIAKVTATYLEVQKEVLAKKLNRAAH